MERPGRPAAPTRPRPSPDLLAPSATSSAAHRWIEAKKGGAKKAPAKKAAAKKTAASKKAAAKKAGARKKSAPKKAS